MADKSIDEFLEDLANFNIITQTEINKLKSISVMPLPNVVKDRATELKERIANTVVDTDNGVVGIMNKRLEVLCGLLDKIASSENVKALANAENQQPNAMILDNILIEELLSCYQMSVAGSAVINQNLTVLGKATINEFERVNADLLQYKDDNNEYQNVKEKIETLEATVSQKQNRLVAGAGISIDNSNRISVTAFNLNYMPNVAKTTSNNRINIISNVNNEVQKMTLNDVASRIIKTVDEMPNDLEVGQYVFLNKEEEN